MKQYKKKELPTPGIQITSMIDCVFLLLAYFIVTTSMDQSELDISFQLPGLVEQTTTVSFPDEQVVEIRERGEVVVNEYIYSHSADQGLERLQAMLVQFRQTSEANKTVAAVTLAPAAGVAHQRVVQVMDTLLAAGIAAIHFALE